MRTNRITCLALAASVLSLLFAGCKKSSSDSVNPQTQTPTLTGPYVKIGNTVYPLDVASYSYGTVIDKTLSAPNHAMAEVRFGIFSGLPSTGQHLLATLNPSIDAVIVSVEDSAGNHYVSYPKGSYAPNGFVTASRDGSKLIVTFDNLDLVDDFPTPGDTAHVIVSGRVVSSL